MAPPDHAALDKGQKLKWRPPDILARPPVQRFAILDFTMCSQILRVAEAIEDGVKRPIETLAVMRQKG